MKRKITWIISFIALLLFLSPLSHPQAKITGEIQGVVEDEEGQVLPGATVTLTGENLFQKSISIVSTERGFFRFLNLNPGSYDLEFTIPGFNILKNIDIEVSVGKTTPIQAKLTPAAIKEEVVVVAGAPLIETKTTKRTTHYTTDIIESIPVPNRDIKDLINSTAGINDNLAFGAGGRVNNPYAEGSMTSSYRVNGVDVSDVSIGYTYSTPIWEAIEELEIVGIGATAEYGNFTGAAINIITKSGTNDIHGGFNLVYKNDKFRGDNSGGNDQLRQGAIDHDGELTGTLSGPLIKEKLFFFLAGGYIYKKSTSDYQTEIYQTWKRPNYYLKLDWVINNRNTLTFMLDGNPLTNDNLGISGGAPESTGLSETLRMNTWHASWQSILSETTYVDARYAGFRNIWARNPNAPGVPLFYDLTTYQRLGGGGLDFDYRQTRHEVNSSLLHYADDFLKASHEFKVGFEYMRGHQKDDLEWNGGGTLYMYPPMGAITMWRVMDMGAQHPDNVMSRIGGYIQDNVKIGKKLNLNLGVRFDTPKLTAKRFTGTVVKYTTLSPRIGFSYDFGGNAKNVLRFSYGRYFNKAMTQTFMYNLPGAEPGFYYMAFLPTASFDPTIDNILAMWDLVAQPQYMYGQSASTEPIAIDPDFKIPGNDTISVGFDKHLFANASLSIDYTYRNMVNPAMFGTTAEHTFASFEWTDPWLGKTVTVWQQTDSLPDELYLTNSSWLDMRTHLVTATFRKRMSGRWSMIASFVYEDTKGNMRDTGDFLFGFPVFNVDNDPQYTEDPWQWGPPRMQHKYQVKMLGTYMAPFGISISGNMRWLSGIFWFTEIGGFYAGLTRSYGSVRIPLEPRGANYIPAAWLADIRLAKSFRVGSSMLELKVDVFNVFNAQYSFYVSTNPLGRYSNGESNYGKPSYISSPRQARIGIGWRF